MEEYNTDNPLEGIQFEGLETCLKYHYSNKKCIELAKDYLKENPKKKEHYLVDYRIDIMSDLNVGLYIKFTDGEIKCLHHILDDLTVEYAIADIIHSPKYVFEDENFDPSYKAIFQGILDKFEEHLPSIPGIDDWTISDIDLNPKAIYLFRRIFFPKGFDEKPEINYFGSALIDDNDYIGLLALKLCDKNFRFNELRQVMPNEYESLSRTAEFTDPILRTKGPYAIEMTEVDDDVAKILGEEKE